MVHLILVSCQNSGPTLSGHNLGFQHQTSNVFSILEGLIFLQLSSSGFLQNLTATRSKILKLKRCP